MHYRGCTNFSGWNLMKALAISNRQGWVRHVAHQVARLDAVSARPLPYSYWHQRLTLPDRNPPPV